MNKINENCSVEFVESTHDGATGTQFRRKFLVH